MVGYTEDMCKFLLVTALLAGLIFCVSCVEPPEANSQAASADRQEECPTWFFWNKVSKQCECHSIGQVRCSQARNHTWLRRMNCMTYDNKTSSTVVALCPFSSFKAEPHHYMLLPENRSQLNDAMCDKVNRNGLLCSRCKPGYGPAVLSYGHSCAKCSGGYSGWLLYICLALIPTTVFFLIIVLCQVRTTSAPMNLLVFTYQLVSVSIAQHPHEVVYYSKTAKIVYGIGGTLMTSWNLDFFRLVILPFCVSENLSNLQVLCMDYIVAFYPLLLTVVMYVCIQQHARGCRLLVCLWIPFDYCLSPVVRRFNWNPAASTVPIFTSFLILSSSKLLVVSASLLQAGEFTTLSSGGQVARYSDKLYYDPNLIFFGQSHLPYAVLAVLVSTAFVILPGLLLILYPTRLLQTFLNCCGLSRPAVHAFADAFNGCYKNGTSGTRDYRSFAGFYLLARVLMTMIFPYMGVHHQSLRALLSVWFLFIFALASPYKNRLFNILDSLGITLLTCSLYSTEYRDVLNAICGVYFTLYFVTLVCCKIVFSLNCCCCQKLKALVDQMFGVSDARPIETEAGGVEGNLVDRQVNPDGFRLLAEMEEPNNDSSVSTYGSISSHS